MTVLENARQLADTVMNSEGNVRVQAAKDLVALKQKSKKSFSALGLTETEEAQVRNNAALELEAVSTQLKMPAGVHKLSNMPKGNDVKGKVWTTLTVVLPDGSSVDGRVEQKRGGFVYFYVDGQGYRADRFRFVGESDGVFDLTVKKA